MEYPQKVLVILQGLRNVASFMGLNNIFIAFFCSSIFDYMMETTFMGYGIGSTVTVSDYKKENDTVDYNSTESYINASSYISSSSDGNDNNKLNWTVNDNVSAFPSASGTLSIHRKQLHLTTTPNAANNWFDEYNRYDFFPSEKQNSSSSILFSQDSHRGIPFLVHVYGFATLFIWLDFFIVFVSITSKKRMMKRPSSLAIIILLLIFSTGFAVLLTIDPYGLRDLLPSVFVTVIVYFKYMSFIIVFWLIQHILKNMASIKQLNSPRSENTNNEETDHSHRSGGKKINVFIPMCLVYLIIMIVVAMVTCIKGNMIVLHLIPQAIYVTVIIVLSFTFLYSALNISEYTKQMKRIFNETKTYSTIQSHLKQNGRCADLSLDLYRVKRDKFEIYGDQSPEHEYDEMNQNGSYKKVHRNDSSDTDGSLTFYNSIALADPVKLEAIFKNKQYNPDQNVEGQSKEKTKVHDKKAVKSANENKGTYNQQYTILDSTTDCGSNSNGDESSIESPLNDSSTCTDKTNRKPTLNKTKVKLKLQKMSSLLLKKERRIGAKRKANANNTTKSITTVFCNNAYSSDNHYAAAFYNHQTESSHLPSPVKGRAENYNDRANTLECNNKSSYNDVNVTLKAAASSSSCQHNYNASAVPQTEPLLELKQQQQQKQQKHETAKSNIYLIHSKLLTHARCEDNGYLADTENALVGGDEVIDIDEIRCDECMECLDKNHQQNNKSCHSNTKYDACNIKCTSGQHTAILKTNCKPKTPSLPKRYYNYLGLQRVRKGRCVQRIMYATYGTTVFAFLLSILELYEMFSVKGLLTKLGDSEEFTWLFFQSVMRVSEIGFGTTIIRSLQILGKPRRTVHKRPTAVHSNVNYTRESMDDSDIILPNRTL